jgi:hypothetical protein
MKQTKEWSKLIDCFDDYGLNSKSTIGLLMEYMVAQMDGMDETDDVAFTWLGISWDKKDIGNFYNSLLAVKYG